MSKKAEKCKSTVSLGKCNRDVCGMKNDEVGKAGKRWDEWGDRVPEEGTLMVYPGGNEKRLKCIPKRFAGSDLHFRKIALRMKGRSGRNERGD